MSEYEIVVTVTKMKSPSDQEIEKLSTNDPYEKEIYASRKFYTFLGSDSIYDIMDETKMAVADAIDTDEQSIKDACAEDNHPDKEWEGTIADKDISAWCPTCEIDLTPTLAEMAEEEYTRAELIGDGMREDGLA